MNMDRLQDAIFCNNIGNSTDNLRCCYLHNQDSRICQRLFKADGLALKLGCGRGNCIDHCDSPEHLYHSVNQDHTYNGTGEGVIRRYRACVNVPNLIGFRNQSLLNEQISDITNLHIPPNVPEEKMRQISDAVTGCLTQTCQASRKKTHCAQKCAAVNLMINSTSPNMEGLNECLHTLCTSGYDSLPYADADVIGIGVWSSYIMQCIFVVLFWISMVVMLVSKQRPKPAVLEHATRTTTISRSNYNNPKVEEISSHQARFEGFLIQFHKAQCYFSITLQVASLSYGIFDTDMLVTFLLIPLATNGVLPVVFAFMLILRLGRATLEITILTLICWFLSTLVFWVLYKSMIPINMDITSRQQKFLAYQQFMYKLTAIDACGGYSALAVCPHNFDLGRKEIVAASHKIRVLTPIIWGFSTLCLCGVLGLNIFEWIRYRHHQYHRAEHSDQRVGPNDGPPLLVAPSKGAIIYWISTLGLLACVGMQLSLLSIGTSLQMMDRGDWSFGQIMAIAIWVPPLVAYLYDEIKRGLAYIFDGPTSSSRELAPLTRPRA